MIYLAADHRGFVLKEELKEYLALQGYEIEDLGAFQLDPNDDYVDFAIAASEKITRDPGRERGIFICGSGVGMDVVANKFKGVRAALCPDKDAAIQSREHGNTNVLVLAADNGSIEKSKEVVDAWLKTPFSGEERHVRRLKKIEEIENKNFK